MFAHDEHEKRLREDVREFRRLVRACGLVDLAEAFSRLPLALDDLLAASFPVAGGAEEFRRAGLADAGRDLTGLGFHDQGGRLFVSFPSVVFGGTRPAGGVRA